MQKNVCGKLSGKKRTFINDVKPIQRCRRGRYTQCISCTSACAGIAPACMDFGFWLCLFEGAELNLPALGLKRSIKESFVTRGERTLMHDAGHPHSSVSHTVAGERCSDL